MNWDRFLIVDWSGGKDTGPRPRKDAIWAALAGQQPVYLRNRDVAFDWLVRTLEAEIAAGRRVLAGFDFPFGYPTGFAAAVTGSADPLRLWDWFAKELHDTPRSNTRFELAARLNAMLPGIGPFWFNGSRQDFDHLPRKGRLRDGHGLPERRLADTRAKGAFTCWQMGGAGAVGGQVMTGVAVLSRLRRHLGGSVSVWPYQPDTAPIRLVEVWPSLLNDIVRQITGTDIRDEVQVRLLADTLAEMQARGSLQAALDAPEGDHLAEEGWILGLGAEAQMKEAARAVAARYEPNRTSQPPGPAA